MVDPVVGKQRRYGRITRTHAIVSFRQGPDN